MNIGYIRFRQHTATHRSRQLPGVALDKGSFEDKASGKNTQRPQFEAMMNPQISVKVMFCMCSTALIDFAVYC